MRMLLVFSIVLLTGCIRGHQLPAENSETLFNILLEKGQYNFLFLTNSECNVITINSEIKKHRCDEYQSMMHSNDKEQAFVTIYNNAVRQAEAVYSKTSLAKFCTLSPKDRVVLVSANSSKETLEFYFVYDRPVTLLRFLCPLLIEHDLRVYYSFLDKTYEAIAGPSMQKSFDSPEYRKATSLLSRDRFRNL